MNPRGSITVICILHRSLDISSVMTGPRIDACAIDNSTKFVARTVSNSYGVSKLDFCVIDYIVIDTSIQDNK
jgi:hypothetical protein